MKRITRNLFAAFVLAAAPLFVHCSDEGPPTDVYDFVINNTTASELEIWVQTTGAYLAAGTVGANAMVTLQNLQINVAYNFRLSALTTGPGTFLYSRAQTGTATTTVTWTVP